MVSSIRVTCAIEGQEIQFSPQQHFDTCSSCHNKYEHLSKDATNFPSLFKLVMEWAIFSNHVLQIKCAMVEARSTRDTMGMTILGLEENLKSQLFKHQSIHSSFTQSQAKALEILGDRKEALLDIVLHIFPLLDKRNQFT